MTANEIYALTPESTTHALWDLSGCYYNHVAEAGDSSEWNSKETTRITVKTIKYFNFDGRRIWRLSTVWFDEKPVMIIQNAGREGDDHRERFITDKSLFCEMVTHIRSLAGVEVLEVLDPEKDSPDLTKFYGYELSGPFERFKH